MLINQRRDPINIKSSMETRLLTIFRALAVIRLFISLLFLILPRQGMSQLYWTRSISIFDVMLLLLYLSIPFLWTKLGRFYLPVAIGWATVMPLLIQNITLYWQVTSLPSTSASDLQYALVENTLILGSINQTILVLIVPLIVVGWAYSRTVLTLYCIGIALFDLSMTILFVPINITVFLVAFALIIFRTMLYAVIGVMINQIVSIQLEQQQKLIDANEKLHEYAVVREQLATSRERNRIARELHDTLAHTLSVATVQLEAVSIIWEQQPQKAHQMVTKSATIMREGLAETRRALSALRAGSLDHENLVDAIMTLADSLMTRYVVTIEVHALAPVALGNAAVEHGLYRIVQEAMFNAARHAQATHITVTLETLPRQLNIIVADDGVGFAVEAASRNGHFGLSGMQERAQQIRADLHIISRVGEGTKIIVTWNTQEGVYAHSDL